MRILAGSVLSAQGRSSERPLLFGNAAVHAYQGLRRRLQSVLRSPQGHPIQVARSRRDHPSAASGGSCRGQAELLHRRVSGVSDSEAPARQHAYLRALGTLPEVRVHFGSFLAKTAWRPLTNLPVTDKRIETPAPVTLPAGHHSPPRSVQQGPATAHRLGRDGGPPR